MSFLSNLFRNNNPAPQDNSLENIRCSGNNFEHVPASTAYPEHLVAHGNFQVPGQPLQDVLTAIQIKGQNVELSTNVGVLPNSSLGGALTESFNHRIPGKFVNFESDQRDKTDLVYVTSAPPNPVQISQELENHAKTQAVVQHVLNNLSSLGQPNPSLDYRQTRNLTQNIVDSSLDLRNQLESGFTPGSYFPVDLNR